MPVWRNNPHSYGLMAIICHWITAVAVIGLFALGLWMTGLDYYHPWYQSGPNIHRSLDILLAMLVLWRLMWRLTNAQPEPLPSHRLWERIIAKTTHTALYLLLFCMFVSGYLITTAEGKPLYVFNWFSVPAAITGSEIGINNLEDQAGDLHETMAYILMALAGLHALAALKHHFVDKDRTLLRMLGNNPDREG